VTEAVTRMQQHLFDDLAAIEQSHASKFVGGVDSQNEWVHFVSWEVRSSE